MGISDGGNAAGPSFDAKVVDSTNNIGDEDEEKFIYPVAADGSSQPSPARLESLFAAASSGDLSLLKMLFKNAQDSGVQPFSLANDAMPRTGSTALHTAASRGYIDIVAWLIKDCGAMHDLEDREGETALHRASLHGHLNVVRYLMECGADVCAKDADGWTALHNACSKGYLDIVRCLCEEGKLATMADGIDARNKDGWTPLMNASSKGHLPIVLYLVKQRADPLIRNKWGETAYDTSAAVFQVWICEVLQQVEMKHWRNSPYNPLAVHTTLPVIIHENQKLDTRLKTLAVSGPKFSASALDRREGRPPFEIKFPKPPISGAAAITAWSDVQLPFRDDPWFFPKPSKPGKQTADTDDRGHFWLSEWIVDVTHPKVDARDGWQYAHRFTDADEQWTAEKPPSLERVLKDGGVVAGSVRAPQTWVRRRRWVRIFRRRIDVPPLPFLQADGNMYHLDSDGTLIPYVDEKSQDDGGKGPGTMAPTILSSSAQDYVASFRSSVGDLTTGGDGGYPSSTAAELSHSVAKLEHATQELRLGILADEDGGRKTQAEVLFNVYNRELERLKLAAGPILSEDDSEEGEDSSDFRYPGPLEDHQSITNTSTLTIGPPVEDHQSITNASTLTAGAHVEGYQSITDASTLTVGAHVEDYQSITDASTLTVGAHVEDYQSITDASTLTVGAHVEDYQSITNPPTLIVGAHVDDSRSISRASTLTAYSVSHSPTDLTPQLSQVPDFRVPTREAPQFGLASKRFSHQSVVWERDEKVSNCRDCGCRFGFLTRRHCRRCGRIFCDSCSALRALLDPPQAPDRLDSSRSSNLQRVCRACYADVTGSLSFQHRKTAMEPIVIGINQLKRTAANRSQTSRFGNLLLCPVCNFDLEQLGETKIQDNHIKECLQGAAKYLVYDLPAGKGLIGAECVLCPEQIVKESTVARLSCSCTFHNSCLAAWLQRGKSCPEHAR